MYCDTILLNENNLKLHLGKTDSVLHAAREI